jgi:purine-binding chemotaxis protein CheW
MSDAIQLCTFHLGDGTYALPVGAVREVLRPPRLTPVPLAPPEVVGVANLRGQIVPVLDLRLRLGLDSRRQAAHVLMLRVADSLFGVLVDSVGDVVEVDRAAFEPVPDTVVVEKAELLSGAFKLPDRLLLVLYVDKILRG